MVGIPSWNSVSGRQALPKVWEWSGGSPGGLGVVGRPFQRTRNGRTTLSEIRERLGGPPKRAGSGREAAPEVCEWLKGPPGGLGWSVGPPEGPRVVVSPFPKVRQWS